MNISLLAVSALILAGCVSAAPPASIPAQPNADGGTYGTVAKLKDAFVKAGGVCREWSENSFPFLNAAQQGSCDNSSFATYSSEADKQEYVTYFKQFSAGGHNSILIGKNWVIVGTHDEVAHAEQLLGGIVINATP